MILSPDDPGFAVAANDVIRRSANDDILLVNPDARVSVAAIQLMRDVIDQDLTLGLVTSMVRPDLGHDPALISAAWL